MKLLDYLNSTSDDLEKNSIRSGRIEIVTTRTKDLLETVNLEKDVVTKINRLLNEANKKLRRDVPLLQLKYKFVSEEVKPKKLDELNLDEEKREKIKKRWLTLNSELTKIQMEWEEK